jgi:hypothetical protein
MCSACECSRRPNWPPCPERYHSPTEVYVHQILLPADSDCKQFDDILSWLYEYVRDAPPHSFPAYVQSGTRWHDRQRYVESWWCPIVSWGGALATDGVAGKGVGLLLSKGVNIARHACRSTATEFDCDHRPGNCPAPHIRRSPADPGTGSRWRCLHPHAAATGRIPARSALPAYQRLIAREHRVDTGHIVESR